jgi:hypothetical protein
MTTAVKATGDPPMKYAQAITMILLGMAFFVGIVPWGMAGEAREPPVMTYQGQIRSVKIDRCGLQPGSCEGSIILAKRGGGEVMLAIKPGTWIRRGGLSRRAPNTCARACP